MATVNLDVQPVGELSAGAPAGRGRRRSTSHLKLVPETKELRETLRARCFDLVARLDRSRPLPKDEMERVSRGLLDTMGLSEGYLGWTMVVLASAFWHDQVAAAPFERRLFLLPHCLKHAEGCPADYDDYGLDCRKCGACSIADFRTTAEDLGYKVLVAEGSPIVLKIIVSGYVDAIVGVACLNVLEKAIDKILLAGIPCQAVPLLSSDCRNTSVDEDWVMEMIRVRLETPAVHTRTYVHLMRGAAELFERQTLDRLAPRLRKSQPLQPSAAPAENGNGSHKEVALTTLRGPSGRSELAGLDPIAGTEAIAYDFLAKGGKHSRPFITLAAYDALTGARASGEAGAQRVSEIPDSVKRAALSIETFHKASLVHDDIEDDDPYRYGDETVHRRFGIPTAINVGDYLIGLGYRLVSRESAALGAEVAADVLDRLADAHLKLSEGQGAELIWRDSREKQLTPLDALKIYALKTAPAFEAALFTGLRLAGAVDDATRERVTQFARNLGVAFQILNDLGDWEGDDHNKLLAAGDVTGGRPTVLWALALEGLKGPALTELQQVAASTPHTPATIGRIRALYQQAGVFDKAHRLIDKYQQRAESLADEMEPEELRRLLYFLVDTVIDRKAPAEPAVVQLSGSLAGPA